MPSTLSCVIKVLSPHSHTHTHTSPTYTSSYTSSPLPPPHTHTHSHTHIPPTHTSSDTEVELEQSEWEEEEEEEEERERTSSELFIGAREMEMYQKTEAVRRALQLRRGSSFYGSMPETLLARRGSAPQPFVALKQRMLHAAVSRGG